MAENNKRLLILGKNGGGSSTQVQSDWAETNTESVSYIKNKPTISDAEIVIKQNNVIKGSFTLNQNGPATINLEGGGGGGSTQVQSDWAETNTESVSYIKNKPTLSIVATSGNYDDLLNKPTIPDAQVNSDWNASSGISQILNKPSLATVATTGSYSDLSNTPTIPAVNDATITFTQGGVSKGSITLNQSSDATIAFDAGGGGTNVYENQILLPLYFENISDTSKDVFLGLSYNEYGGRFPNISLQKSLNNTDWEDITIPTTDGGREIISIPPKSRVYIKGVNEKFCNYQDGGYYNHYYFGTDKINREYIFVGGNLMSIIKGDKFKTYKDNYGYTLSSYAFCKLFVDGYFSGVGDPNIIHFEKMVVGFPSGTDINPNSNSFSYIFNTMTSPLNLSHRTIYKGSNPKTNWCVGVNDIILNTRFTNNDYDLLTTSTKDYLHIGFINGSTGISSYKQIIDKPNMTTETLTFVDENNVETNVIVYTQPTV